MTRPVIVAGSLCPRHNGLGSAVRTLSGEYTLRLLLSLHVPTSNARTAP